MLNAIVIYDNSNKADKGNPKKLKHACQKSRGLFGGDDLENLNKAAQSIMIEGIGQNQIYQFKVENEYQYFKQFKSDNQYNVLIAISSRKAIDNNELCYLFNNILHVHIRSEKVKTTLDNIIINPFGYTGKDLLIGTIEKTIAETKVQAVEMLETLHGRTLKLKDLEEKTHELNLASKEFVKRTEKMNSCCG